MHLVPDARSKTVSGTYLLNANQYIMEGKFEIGEIVRCINIEPLESKNPAFLQKIAPPLELGKIYKIFSITPDKAGNQHLDVGLTSMYNYITSYETGEELIGGDSIHWCHPSRFMKENTGA